MDGRVTAKRRSVAGWCIGRDTGFVGDNINKGEGVFSGSNDIERSSEQEVKTAKRRSVVGWCTGRDSGFVGDNTNKGEGRDTGFVGDNTNKGNIGNNA
jgi:hypothetical protein